MHEKYDRDMIDLLRSIQNIDYIEPDEIPNIDLYMDQITTFTTGYCCRVMRVNNIWI